MKQFIHSLINKVKYLIVVMFVITISFALSSCKEVKVITSIEIQNINGDDCQEFLIGEFDYSAYVIIVHYSDNTSREVAFDESFVPEADKLLFYQEGIHEIHVEHNNLKDEFEISVLRNTFENVYLENQSFTYDGQPHGLEVSGDIPANAQINFTSGNEFVSVGNYDVECVLSCDGYVSKTLNAKLKIALGVYDLSNIIFNDTVYVYDGTNKKVVIEGTLPKEVSVSYTMVDTTTGKTISGNTVKEAGIYMLTANFTSTNVNYEDIPAKTIKLTIEKATYNMSKIVFKDVEYVYDGKAKTLVIENTDKLPNGVAVTYSDHIFTNAGVYEVTAYFIGDSYNYNAIPVKTATLTIKPAEPKVMKIYYNDQEYSFDGNPHFEPLMDKYIQDENITGVEYIIHKGYDYNGEVVEAAINAGTYIVEANVEYRHGDPNYAKIPSVYSILTIDKASLSDMKIERGNFYYDGSIKHPRVEGENDAPSYTTTGNSLIKHVEYHCYTNGIEVIPINVGNYTIVATITLNDEYAMNYTYNDTITGDFSIEKQMAYMNYIFEDCDFTYNGNIQTIRLINENLIPNIVAASTIPIADSVTYTITKDGFTTLSDKGGVYTVTATFEMNPYYSDKYLGIEPVSTTYEIKKLALNHEYAFNDISTFDENGSEQYPTINNDFYPTIGKIDGELFANVTYSFKKDNVSVSPIEGGTYVVHADFTINPVYADSYTSNFNSLEKTFIIRNLTVPYTIIPIDNVSSDEVTSSVRTNYPDYTYYNFNSQPKKLIILINAGVNVDLIVTGMDGYYNCGCSISKEIDGDTLKFICTLSCNYMNITWLMNGSYVVKFRMTYVDETTNAENYINDFEFRCLVLYL